MFLKELLSPFLSPELPENVLENTLKEVGCHPAAIYEICQESMNSMTYLKSLSESKDQPTEQALRDFLTKRWNHIHNTDASYTSFPQSPINQICLAIAQHLAQPHEPIAQVLMPTLSVIHYDILGDDLMSLTETVNSSGQRELNLSSFLISEKGNAIIPIEGWFQAQIQNTGVIYNHLYSENDKLVPFTAHEIFLIQQSAAPNSMIFLDDFSLRKKLMSAKGTFAEALLKLCDDLMNNGASSGHGTVVQADNNVYPLITDFLLIWYKKLSDEQRDALGALKASDTEKTLETHLLILQSAAYSVHLPPLTQAQLDSIRGMETCVEVNSRAIQCILETHPDQFSKIMLAKTAEFSNNKLQAFDTLLESIKEKLKQREVHIRNHSKHAMKLLYPKTRHKLQKENDEYSFALLGVSKKLLKQAIVFNNTQALSTMLRYIDDINAFSSPEQSILDFTLRFSSFSTAALLLDAGAKLSALEINKKDSLGHTCLDTAISSKCVGAEKVACALINAGADLNEISRRSETSLLLTAFASGNENIIEAVLKREDIDLHACDSEGRNALYYAVLSKNIKLIKFLASRGADINAPLGKTTDLPIYLALEHRHEATILALLELGAKTDFTNNQGNMELKRTVTDYFATRYWTQLVQRGAHIRSEQDWSAKSIVLAPDLSLFEVALSLKWTTIINFLLEQNQGALSQMPALKASCAQSTLLLHLLFNRLSDPKSSASFPKRKEYLKEVLMTIIQRNLGDKVLNCGFYSIWQYFHKAEFTASELLSLPRSGLINYWVPSITSQVSCNLIYHLEAVECSPVESIYLFACAIEWNLYHISQDPQVIAFAENLCQAINARDLSKVCSLMIHTKRTSSLAHYKFITPVLRDAWNHMPVPIREVVLANQPPESTCFPKLFSRREAGVTPLNANQDNVLGSQTLRRG